MHLALYIDIEFNTIFMRSSVNSACVQRLGKRRPGSAIGL